MNKQWVDFIGTLLFEKAAAGPAQHLQLKSEKQFHVGPGGRLEKEQSVLTNIVLAKDAIQVTYQLPDGHTVCFVNAITEVDCQLNNDYTIGRIIYKTIPGTTPDNRNLPSQFTLDCSDDTFRLFEAHSQAGSEACTCFEIA